MRIITEDMRIDDLKRWPVFQETGGLFQGRRDGEPKDEEGRTFTELEKVYPSWKSKKMIRGLMRLQEVSESGIKHVFRVYSPEEIEEEPSREKVALIRFPGDAGKPYILVIPGGAFVSVCSLPEGYPTAESFNRMGYTVFVLTYRTWKPGEILYPQPMDDVAAAIRFISAHEKDFELPHDRYAVCGFSAGGGITNQWGAKSCGYAHYGLPKPEVLFSNYSSVSVEKLPEEQRHEICSRWMGENWKEEDLLPYNVLWQADKDYPPVYLTVCLDDELLPASQTLLFRDVLKELGVPFRAEISETGLHGYGDGEGMEMEGWPERAVDFWRTITSG